MIQVGINSVLFADVLLNMDLFFNVNSSYNVFFLRSHPTNPTPMLPSTIAPGAGIGS